MTGSEFHNNNAVKRYFSLAKLSELIDPEHVNDGRSFRLPQWPEECWFQPIFIDKRGYYVGLDQEGNFEFWIGDSNAWDVVQPKSKMVTRWQWAGPVRDFDTICTAPFWNGRFFTEEEFKQSIGPMNINDFTKLEYTRTEFPA